VCKGSWCDAPLQLAWPIGGGSCPVALDGSAQVQSQGYAESAASGERGDIHKQKKSVLVPA
jgi:hypothetical protein